MRRLRSTVLLFLETRSIVLFIVGAICIGVVSNAVYDWLMDWLGPNPLVVFILGLVAFIALVVFVHWFREFAQRRARNSRLRAEEYETPQCKRGCIVLVSQVEAAKTGLKPHLDSLQRCWLIHSAQSKEQAEDVARWLDDNKDGAVVVELRQVDDVSNPIEFYKVVGSIYSSLPSGLQPNDVIADFTGLTKNASVGMVLACLDADRELQYVAEERRADGTGTRRSLPPRAIVLSWEHIGKPESADR